MRISVLSLLVFALLAWIANSQEQGTCPQPDRLSFIEESLSQECADALMSIQFRSPPPVPMVNLTSTAPTEFPLGNFTVTPITDEDLDTVCVSSCAGAYSTWLRDGCNDPYTARSIDAGCELTEGTADLGSRCRFGFPDAFIDPGLFLGLFHICSFAESDPCSSDAGNNTETVCGLMSDIIDLYGCCYQSLYNNTDFITFLTMDDGPLTTGDRLIGLGRSPLWEQCEVDVPDQCSSAMPVFVDINLIIAMVLILPLIL